VERYTSLSVEAPPSATDPNPTAGPPRSPALSTRTTATGAPLQPAASPMLTAAIPTSASQPQPYTSSPTTMASPSPVLGPAGSGIATPGTADLHLSGQEPRYYPGMVSRSQGRGSMRRESGHESDPR
jgi:AMP deaminase